MALTLNGDDGIAGVNGSASTPAIQGTDTNTGLTFGTDTVNVVTGGSTRTTVDSSGNLGVGTTVPDSPVHIKGTGQTFPRVETTSSTNDAGWKIKNGTREWSTFVNGTDGAYRIYDETASSERMRVISDGTVFIAKTGYGLGTVGIELQSNGVAYATSNNNNVLIANRLGSDGDVIAIYQDTVKEGSISVSGTTVSYNGAHLSRWSQLPGGVERTEILRGSVLSNIDEMCVWAYAAEPEVLWAEGDELPEGVSVGDVKTPAKSAGTELNEQLNRMKVSDVEGDPNVAGVFQCWDDDDDTYTNDFYCAMTGDFVIRIAQGVTVARGDLLMSAGDGTAKPQDDDIIRSKTIAKVTSANVSCTYDDGSYCVPCVLMAC